MLRKLDRAFIEYIHDVLVSLWMPYDEHIDPNDYKDIPLLESAVGRPFQTFGGQDLFPTIPDKAAALFHGLVCNHCFHNGNKRTAVIVLDYFMLLNGRLLAISNKDIYDLADQTAKANRDGRRHDDVLRELTRVLTEQSVDIREIQTTPEAVRALGKDRMEKMVERLRWSQQVVDQLLKDQGIQIPENS